MKTIIPFIVLVLTFSKGYSQREDFWELLPKPDGLCFWDIEHVIDETIVASSDSGLYISYNNGDSWQKTSFTYETRDIEAGSNGFVCVCQMPGAFMWYSLDTCKTWTKVTYDVSGIFLMTIHIDPDNSVYVGSNSRVYRSLDYCQTWEEVMFNPATPWVKDVGRNPVTGYIYASFGCPYDNFEGLWGSPSGDAGTWTTKNMLHDNASCIAFDHIGNTYIGVWDNLHTGFSGIYKSGENDTTWDILFWCKPPSSIVMLPNTDMYIASPIVYGEGDMYFYNHETGDINVFTSEISTHNIEPLKLFNNYLFTNTQWNHNWCDSSKLHRSKEPLLSIEVGSFTKTIDPFEIFPNPVLSGNQITIKLTNNLYDSCYISIYDVYGNKVLYTFKNEETFKINTLGLNPGIYIITLQKGGETYTKKLIIR